MRTTMLTVLLANLLLISSIDALGINCRGSLVCRQGFDSVPRLLQAIVEGKAGPVCPGGPISDFILWKAGRQIACISAPKGAGAMCLFMQGNVPALGIPGNIIKERLRDLVKHGCISCGSVPLSGNNDPDELGILTVNFVAEPQCRGVCYPDGTASLTSRSPRSDGTGLERRNNVVKVNAFPESAVYILVKLTSQVFEQKMISEVTELLDGALAFAMAVSESSGYDTLIPGGLYTTGTSPKFTVWNANNHQITWNALYCTIMALSNFLQGSNYGSADFAVYDGRNKVGEGVFSTH